MGNKGVLVLMNEVIEKIVKLISGITDREGERNSQILKARYEFLELLVILKEQNIIDGNDVERIYKKGETYEQSSNESRGSTGDIHQGVPQS
jgi:hypothetical protein